MSEKAFYKSINLEQRPPSVTTPTTITASGALAQPTTDITFYVIDTTAGAITLTLPDPAAMTYSQQLYLVNIAAANAAAIQTGAAGDTVNGVAFGSTWSSLSARKGLLVRKLSDTSFVGVQV